jgi:hypothetical protein
VEKGLHGFPTVRENIAGVRELRAKLRGGFGLNGARETGKLGPWGDSGASVGDTLRVCVVGFAKARP